MIINLHLSGRKLMALLSSFSPELDRFVTELSGFILNGWYRVQENLSDINGVAVVW